MSEKLVLKINFEVFQDYDSLSQSDKVLIDAAQKSSSNAYAPYSHFCVGAAVISDKGTITTGNNQENAAFPSGLCAERVTLFSAFSQFPNDHITTLAVVAHNNDQVKPAFPCGSCRQTILEYEMRQKEPIRVIMTYNKGSFLIANSIKDLLPLGFTNEDL